VERFSVVGETRCPATAFVLLRVQIPWSVSS
jgi:hypothetical protein